MEQSDSSICTKLLTNHKKKIIKSISTEKWAISNTQGTLRQWNNISNSRDIKTRRNYWLLLYVKALVIKRKAQALTAIVT